MLIGALETSWCLTYGCRGLEVEATHLSGAVGWKQQKPSCFVRFGAKSRLRWAGPSAAPSHQWDTTVTVMDDGEGSKKVVELSLEEHLQVGAGDTQH